MKTYLLDDIDDAAYKFAQSRVKEKGVLRNIIEDSFILGAYYVYNKLIDIHGN